MPRDRKPDLELERSIRQSKKRLEVGKCSSIACAKVCALEKKKANLDLQLFDADDSLLGDAYDKEEVKRLKNEIGATEKEMSSLESHTDVAAMRAQERKISMFEKKERAHQDLMELSESEPGVSLRRAVILSSNKICGDCEKFTEKVNKVFKLDIVLSWRE